MDTMVFDEVLSRIVEQSMKREKYGWSIRDWGDATGTCRSVIYELIRDGKIQTVVQRKHRIIITHPVEYLASLREK